MAFFGLFGRRKSKRSPDFAQRLEEIEYQSRLEGLQDRRNARELRLAAINHPNPNVLLTAADGLYRPRGGKNTAPLVAPPYETRESKIIDVLLARALMDPDEKLDELRERQLKRRKLMREMDDDEDDDEDEGPLGNLKQMAPLLLLAAPMLLNPAVAERMAPMFERMFTPPAPPIPPEPPPTTHQVVYAQPAPMPPPAPAASVAIPPTAESVGATPALEGSTVTVHPAMVLHALRTMEPTSFAEWILRQPGGYQFVEQLAEIPEDQLGATLEGYAKLPRVGPLAQWGEVIAYLAENQEQAAAIMALVRQAYEAESQAI